MRGNERYNRWSFTRFRVEGLSLSAASSDSNSRRVIGFTGSENETVVQVLSMPMAQSCARPFTVTFSENRSRASALLTKNGLFAISNAHVSRCCFLDNAKSSSQKSATNGERQAVAIV